MSKYDPKKWLTEKGSEAITQRLNSYIVLFNEHGFPFSAKMFGFPSINVESKEDCFSRIKELVELTGSKIQVVNCITRNTDGSENLKQNIKILELEVIENDC